MADLARLGIVVESQQVARGSQELDRLAQSGRRAEDQVERLGRGSQRMGGFFRGAAGEVLGMVGRLASIAAIVTTITKLTQASIGAAASFERVRAEFAIMAGSLEGGAALFEEINKFAARTPLELGQLAEVSKMLMSFGTAAGDVIPQLQMLGDAALGNAEKMERLARAFGRVQARGRASMEEVNMAMEAGLPIIDELAKVLGVSNEQVFKLVSEGKVGFEQFNQAFKNMTSATGQFYNGMGVLADTFQGKWSTLMDNVRLLAATIAEGALPGMKDLLDAGTKAADWLTKVFKFDQGGKALEILMRQLLDLVRFLTSPEFLTAAGVAMRETMLGVGRSLVEGLVGLFKGLYAAAIRVADRLGGDWWKYVINAITRVATGGATPAWIKGFLGISGYEGWQPFAVSDANLSEIIRQELTRNDVAESVVGAGKTILSGTAKVIGEQLAILKGMVDRSMFRSNEEWARFNENLARLDKEAQAKSAAALATVPGRASAAGTESSAGRTEFRPDARSIPYWDEANLAVDEHTARLVEQADALEMRLGPAQRAYNVELANLNALQPYLSAQAYAAALDELNDKYPQLQSSSERFLAAMKDLGEQLLRTTLDATLGALEEIGGLLEKGGLNAESFGNAVGQMVLQLLNALPTLFLAAGLNLIATNPAMWPIGLALIAAAGITAIGAGYANSYAQGSAHGNVFENGRMLAFAGGGVVTRPTFFPMANGTGLMGEAGPEAIMPLRRLANGNLGVHASGGGAVSVVVNNYSGEPVERRERRRPNGDKEVEILIGSIVQRQLANGALDKSMSANYGVRRRGQRI